MSGHVAVRQQQQQQQSISRRCPTNNFINFSVVVYTPSHAVGLDTYRTASYTYILGGGTVVHTKFRGDSPSTVLNPQSNSRHMHTLGSTVVVKMLWCGLCTVLNTDRILTNARTHLYSGDPKFCRTIRTSQLSTYTVHPR